MDIRYFPDRVKLELILTPQEARELLQFWDKTIEPSNEAKALFSSLHTISNLAETTAPTGGEYGILAAR